MKGLLSFCFFCVSLHCFGMLTDEEMQKADDFSWPEDIIPALYGGNKDTKEDFFVRAFESVRRSSLIDEQKIHLYLWLLIGAESNKLTIARDKIYEFFSSSENLLQLCSYLLSYVEDPEAQILEWNEADYISNRDRILKALYIIRDSVKRLSPGIPRRQIIHIYNQLALKAF